jgi:hypothetical protein
MYNWELVPDTRYPIPDTRYPIPDTRMGYSALAGKFHFIVIVYNKQLLFASSLNRWSCRFSGKVQAVVWCLAPAEGRCLAPD